MKNNKTYLILVMAFLFSGLLIHEVEAGIEGKGMVDKTVFAEAASSVKVIKPTNVEILEIDNSINKNSVKDEAREICSSFMKDEANKSEACLESVESCATDTESKLKAALNVKIQPLDMPRCAYKHIVKVDDVEIPARWVCANDVWKVIQDEVTKAVNDTNKELIDQTCVLNIQNLGKTQNTIPSNPSASDTSPLPAGASKEGTGGLKPDESTTSASSDPNSKLRNINSATTSCSMNSFAVSNLWSFLPFFLLMLVFGMKRKK